MTSARLFIASSLLATFSLGLVDGAEPTFSLTVTAEPAVAKVGSDIKLEVVLKNLSDHQIVISADKGARAELGYGIDVRDEKGDRLRKTNYYRAITGDHTGKSAPNEIPGDVVVSWSIGETGVQPGNTLSDHVVLGKLYDLRQPGKYTIQVRKLDRESKTAVKSNTITVTLTK